MPDEEIKTYTEEQVQSIVRERLKTHEAKIKELEPHAARVQTLEQELLTAREEGQRHQSRYTSLRLLAPMTTDEDVIDTVTARHQAAMAKVAQKDRIGLDAWIAEGGGAWADPVAGRLLKPADKALPANPSAPPTTPPATPPNHTPGSRPGSGPTTRAEVMAACNKYLTSHEYLYLPPVEKRAKYNEWQKKIIETS